MRAGIGSVAPNVDDMFLKKVIAIMKVLMKEALVTAGTFTDMCGRKIITASDTKVALMYQAHEFFKVDRTSEFFEALHEDDEETDEEGTDEEGTDDEETDDEETGDEGTDENEEVYVCDYVQGNRDLHQTMIMYRDTWSDWRPEDPVSLLVKRAIDNISL